MTDQYDHGPIPHWLSLFSSFFVDNRVHVLSRANHAELVRERQVGGGLRTEALAASAASFSVGRVDRAEYILI